MKWYESEIGALRESLPKESAPRARALAKKYDAAQKLARDPWIYKDGVMGVPLVNATKQDREAGEKAFDRMQNMREEEMEALSKRDGYKKGGKISSASRRADGIAKRGKTRGRVV